MIDIQPTPGRDTNEFARAHHVKPQSVRRRYSETGSYFGVKPNKLPNRRLSWPPAPKEPQ
jgi:hypothetical protein